MTLTRIYNVALRKSKYSHGKVNNHTIFTTCGENNIMPVFDKITFFIGNIFKIILGTPN